MAMSRHQGCPLVCLRPADCACAFTSKRMQVTCTSEAVEALAGMHVSARLSFSLGRAHPCRLQEHEAALRFFLRALQLDATLAYAYTLCGHEYFANEDFDKGLQCYRNAIRVDARHYNAWCAPGSGTCETIFCRW